MQHPSNLKIAAAFIAAVLVAALLPAAFLAWIYGSAIGDLGKITAGVALEVLKLGGPVAALLGLPLYLVFRRHNLLSLLQIVLGAVLAGQLGAVAMYFIQGMSSLWLLLALAGSSSAVAGVVFWAVAYRDLSPNNSSKPTPLRGAA